MPRSNRPRGRRTSEPEEVDLSRVLMGRLHLESRRDGQWNVQPVSGTDSGKTYTCPGCGLEIASAVPHTVAWRADGLMGEAVDLAGRRHWHTHCWRTKT